MRWGVWGHLVIRRSWQEHKAGNPVKYHYYKDWNEKYKTMSYWWGLTGVGFLNLFVSKPIWQGWWRMR